MDLTICYGITTREGFEMCISVIRKMARRVRPILTYADEVWHRVSKVNSDFLGRHGNLHVLYMESLESTRLL